MSEQQDPGGGRATFLPVLLASTAAMFFLLVLLLLTGGLFFWVVLFVGFIVGVGSLHWIVWGQLLTRLTAGEREEEELRKRAEELDGPISPAPTRPDYRYRR